MKELLLRTDPCQIKTDLLDRTPHNYKSYKRDCGSCTNFVDETSTIKSNATGRLLTHNREYWNAALSLCRLSS